VVGLDNFSKYGKVTYLSWSIVFETADERPSYEGQQLEIR